MPVLHNDHNKMAIADLETATGSKIASKSKVSSIVSYHILIFDPSITTQDVFSRL